MSSPGFTYRSLRVGKELLDGGRGKRRWNYEIANKIGAKVSTVHGILEDFESRGLAASAFERDAGTMGRAARRLYGLTDAGFEIIGAALSHLQLVPPIALASTGSS